MDLLRREKTMNWGSRESWRKRESAARV